MLLWRAVSCLATAELPRARCSECERTRDKACVQRLVRRFQRGFAAAMGQVVVLGHNSLAQCVPEANAPCFELQTNPRVFRAGRLTLPGVVSSGSPPSVAPGTASQEGDLVLGAPSGSTAAAKPVRLARRRASSHHASQRCSLDRTVRRRRVNQRKAPTAG